MAVAQLDRALQTVERAMSQTSHEVARHRVRRTSVVLVCVVVAGAVALFGSHRGSGSGGGAGTTARGGGAHPTTTSTPALDVRQYGSRSSAATPDGAAWEFVEGLTVRITGATRLDSDVGTQTRDDKAFSLVRIDFSYTNHGVAANVSDGVQLPVRLLYGTARDEATADGGYAGTSEQLTLQVPTRVEPGATVDGAVSFAVPAASTAVLAVLVVEPRRYTEHLFTDVQALFTPAPR